MLNAASFVRILRKDDTPHDIFISNYSLTSEVKTDAGRQELGMDRWKQKMMKKELKRRNDLGVAINEGLHGCV